MSEPNSPTTLPNERTYRFISDPGHKENLSGRVRAACMTCRRKKIKCSGEINCRTCREKGLVCEGLPERKRPKRDGGSLILDPVPSGGIERKRKLSSTKKAFLKRPSIADLKQSTSTASEDSGYASTQPEIGESILSPAPSLLAEQPLDTKQVAGAKGEKVRSGHESMPPGLRIDTWRLNDEPIRRDDTSSFDLSNLRPPSEVSPGAQPPSAAMEPSPVDWTQVPDNDPSWWMDHPNDDAPNLLSTARALEEQAQSLRLMASRQQQNQNDGHDMTSRRQTIAFPLNSPGFEPRYDVLQNQHGIFDDMALLLANRTPGTGLTPGLSDFNSWWDINAGDLMLSPGQTMPMHQRNPFDELPNTSAAAPDVAQQQQISQDSYFGQFWGE